MIYIVHLQQQERLGISLSPAGLSEILNCSPTPAPSIQGVRRVPSSLPSSLPLPRCHFSRCPGVTAVAPVSLQRLRVCWAPLSLPLAVRCALRLTLLRCCSAFCRSLFLWRRHGAAGGDILRTTRAGGHLMFADTLLLKTMMDILFVDARSPGDDVKSPRATGVPFAARATTRRSGLGNDRLGIWDSRCSEDIYLSGTVTLVLSL